MSHCICLSCVSSKTQDHVPPQDISREQMFSCKMLSFRKTCLSRPILSLKWSSVFCLDMIHIETCLGIFMMETCLKTPSLYSVSKIEPSDKTHASVAAPEGATEHFPPKICPFQLIWVIQKRHFAVQRSQNWWFVEDFDSYKWCWYWHFMPYILCFLTLNKGIHTVTGDLGN